MKDNKDMDNRLRKVLDAYEETPHLSFKAVHSGYKRKSAAEFWKRFRFISAMTMVLVAASIVAYIFMPSLTHPEQIKTISYSANSDDETSITVHASPEYSATPNPGASSKKREASGTSEISPSATTSALAEQEVRKAETTSHPEQLQTKKNGSRNTDIQQLQKNIAKENTRASKSASVDKSVIYINSSKVAKEPPVKNNSLEQRSTKYFSKKNPESEKQEVNASQISASEKPVQDTATSVHLGISPGKNKQVAKNKKPIRPPDDITLQEKQSIQASENKELSNAPLSDLPIKDGINGSVNATPLPQQENTIAVTQDKSFVLDNTSSGKTLRSYTLNTSQDHTTQAVTFSDSTFYDDSSYNNGDTLRYSGKKRKRHSFSISTEVLYNRLSTSITANSSYSDADFAQKFSAGHTADPMQLFNGALLLSYNYSNIGMNAGISVLNSEIKVTTANNLSSIPVYSMQIRPPIDTIFPGDTTYILTGHRKYVVVNGDSIGAQDYMNFQRLYMIPLRLSYRFNLFEKRLVIEPQAGVQLGIPAKSYQLTADDKGGFTYASTKAFFRQRLLFYDLSLKLNYRLTDYADIYLRQGYTFSAGNIYRKDYAISRSLKNSYTSLGISIWFNRK